MTDQWMGDEPEYTPSKALAERDGVPDLSKPVGAEGSMSVVDRKLLEVAAKYNGNLSPVQLAEEVGFNITPARAMHRLREILNSRDLITVEQKVQLLMDDLVDLKQYIRDKMDEDSPEQKYDQYGVQTDVTIGDPRWTANMLKVLMAIGTQHDKALARLDSLKAHLSNGHASIVVAALDRMFSTFYFQAKALYPDLDELILRDALEDAVRAGFKIVDDATND